MLEAPLCATINIVLFLCFFFFNDTATTEIYTLSLHDALPISTDIRLEPVKSPDGKVDKIKVTLSANINCPVVRELNQSQRLIDIGKSASTLAHGIRNPLNAIKGAVVYLREKFDNEETLMEFTRIIEEEISRLDNFISMFLSSSMLDVELSESDINSILRKIEVITSLQTHSANIESIYEYGEVPPIMINPFHLEQAILNVINNAIEAMGTGGTLKVKTYTENNSGMLFAVIAISDTGIGMSEKRDNFQSADMGKNGKGFGLFLTNEILKCYDGYLEIKSKKNAGTTVTLYILYK